MKYNNEYWEGVDEVLCNIPMVETLKNKTIVITGATGLVCSTVTDLLLRLNETKEANLAIICAGRSLERLQKRFPDYDETCGLYYMKYDAGSYDNLYKNGLGKIPDYVIHGASNANPAVYTKEPVETMMANIIGLKQMLDIAKEHNSRILYISSSEVYGIKEGNEAYTEESYGYLDILNPRAAYPSSKRAGETLCSAYISEYDLDAVIVRPGHIYGPSITDADNRASSEFARKAVAGEDISMKSKGSQLRSYCHTLDCASAILTVLLNGESGQAYNISNPKSVCTIADIAEAFAEAAGVRITFAEATEQEKKGYNLMSNSSLSSKKLEELGWKASFDLIRGVRKTLQVLRG